MSDSGSSSSSSSSPSSSSSSSSSSLAVGVSPPTTPLYQPIAPVNSDFTGETSMDPGRINLTTYTNELRTNLFKAADLFKDDKLGGDYTKRDEFIRAFYTHQNRILGVVSSVSSSSSPYGQYLDFRSLVKDHNQHWNDLWHGIKRSKAESANADSTSNQMELLNGPYNPRSRWDVACSGHTVLQNRGLFHRGERGVRQKQKTKKAYCNCGVTLEINTKRKYNSKSGFATEPLGDPAFAINSPQAAADIKNPVRSRPNNQQFDNYQLNLTQDDRDLNFFNNLQASVNATTRSVLREQVGDRNTDGNHNYNTNKDVLRSLGNRAEGGFCWYSERLRSGGEIGGGSGGSSSGETKSSGGTGGSDPEKRLVNEKILRGDQAFLWEKNDHKNWMENYCWLCSQPLWINADCMGSPQSEHKMACYLMALTANGLSKTKKKQAYASQTKVGRKGAYELDQSTDNIHLFKHKILIRAEGMAWSHPWCNNHKSQTQFISLRKKINDDGTYTFLYVIEFPTIQDWSLDLFKKSRFRSRIGHLKSIGDFEAAKQVLRDNPQLWHTNNAPSLANINAELGKHPMSAYHMAKDSPGIDGDLIAMESNVNFFWSNPNREIAVQNIITRLIPLVCLLNQASDIEPEAFRYYSNLLGSLGTGGDGQQYWRSWSTKLAPHGMTGMGKQTDATKSAKNPEHKNHTSIANRIRQNCIRWRDNAGTINTPSFVSTAADADTPDQLGDAVKDVLDCINPPQPDGGEGIWLTNDGAATAIRKLIGVDEGVLKQAQKYQYHPSDTSMEYTPPLDGIEEVEEEEEEEEGSEGGGTKKKRRRKRRTRRKRKYHKKTRKRITKKRRKKTKRRRKKKKKTRRR